MKKTDGFLKRLDEEIAKRHILKHPFYKTWEEGKLTLDSLKGYAKQYYHYVKAFPTFLSAVHSNCPDLVTRQKILENLAEEERRDKPHPELWIRFGEVLGVEREEMINTPPLPETINLVETFREITHNRSFVEGQAILYAYESQVPEVSKTKIKGLKKHYNITDSRGLEFFTLHIDVDVEHAKIGKEILEFGMSQIAPSAMRNGEFGVREEWVILSVRDSLNALWKMLDGVQSTFVDKN